MLKKLLTKYRFFVPQNEKINAEKSINNAQIIQIRHSYKGRILTNCKLNRDSSFLRMKKKRAKYSFSHYFPSPDRNENPCCFCFKKQ